MIYVECPLCGDNGGIYGGNRFYTEACCYFIADGNDGHRNISLEVERWMAEHLLAGESIDRVHTTLTGLRSGRTPTRRDYVERIHAILHDTRTADAYKHYLDTGDIEPQGVEEDMAHERAADAAEVNDAVTDFLTKVTSSPAGTTFVAPDKA